MALQIFSVIVLVGALVALIPVARRAFGKQDENDD